MDQPKSQILMSPCVKESMRYGRWCFRVWGHGGWSRTHAYNPRPDRFAGLSLLQGLSESFVSFSIGRKADLMCTVPAKGRNIDGLWRRRKVWRYWGGWEKTGFWSIDRAEGLAVHRVYAVKYVWVHRWTHSSDAEPRRPIRTCLPPVFSPTKSPRLLKQDERGVSWYGRRWWTWFPNMAIWNCRCWKFRPGGVEFLRILPCRTRYHKWSCVSVLGLCRGRPGW